ncbi:MAG: aldo/keto reductase [Alphaproteobacteria bacterium]|nr:aldo/keto reductase [Alphaproteobacteria bacterium]
MRYRALGRTGVKVSEIGFGAWGIGGPTPGPTSYGDTDDAQSLAALAEALRQGITFFDTSNIYGNGHSERLIGQALQDVGDKAFVCTKAGCFDYNEPLDFSPEAIERSVAGSILRLKRPIDLLLLHNPEPTLEGLDAALATMAHLRQDGQIKAFGISLRGPADILPIIERFPSIAAVEVNLNLLDQRAQRLGFLERAAARGISVIARTPLAFGFLSGAFKGDETFAANDHRSRWPAAQVAKWVEGADMFAQRFVPPDQTLVDLALRYCLSCPGIATVIPGILRPEEVAQNCRASDLGRLYGTTMAEIAALYDANDFFVAPPKWVPPLAKKD